jgi:hypothetical protein
MMAMLKSGLSWSSPEVETAPLEELQLRFSIRAFMIAIAIIAGWLALPDYSGRLLAVPALALLAAWWLLSRGHRRTAGMCFGCLATAANVLITVVCAFPSGSLPALFGLVIVLPTIAGFGVAWATLVQRQLPEPRQFGQAAWRWVATLLVLPVVTVWSAWPFRLEFLMARPRLERLADQVAAGQAIRSSRPAGVFRIVGSAVDPTTGNVALMTDAIPGGPSAFIRLGSRPGQPYGCYRPVRGDWLHVSLTSRWCYHEED